MKQTRQIHYRLSELEYQKLATSASQIGLSTSAYAKKLALRSKLIEPKFNHEDAVQLTLALARIGNNLNQLTKQANQGYYVEPENVRSLRDEVNTLWQQLR
ncbi:plasmid mobilization protein [Lactiplantibacillus plantarum]|uniref:plasmid mobilization protein n=1 Tax=Lactiplantibacillus plantarum TaxID=1590 RepID=UPI0007B55251|nr:plasmid mobilization relaxosome protein MobC [Lactiplantibacillus plantarum]MDN6045085.1 MobC family plasmid mobilization relaxosome protein [Lactococcus raffinolactis]MDN5992576.1 MobC family plasmid mobilization relaxosome protein [Lactiplantibacillus plantarum]MDN6577451.1 MobC family plasmid mobilization relaxosome protein [Lactiplantibacillus plantarum]MDN6765551.1 MobC family plasmid mobilization relaxosome protein [Lactiplantibacillus plantarum]TXJ64796.1 MobC family plasmid mobiliza